MRLALALCLVLSAGSAALAQDFVVHSFDKLKLSDKFYSEGAHGADFNKDGQGDVVAGPFWYAGPDFKQRAEIYPPKEFNINGYSDNFLVYTQDVNADGWSDVIVLGFPGKAAYWYENPKSSAAPAEKAEAGHWKKHHIMDVVDNESPMMADITGDGKPELICSSGGKFGYGTPDAANPTAKWTWHVISGGFAGGMFTHGLGVGDVNGDGKNDLLWKDGWLEQPASLDGDPEWKKHSVKFGSGGAQMYAYDFDGDGDNDIVTSLQAHQYGLAWFEQIKKEGAESEFKQHLIVGTKAEENPYGIVYTQMHAIDLVDMDGDGLKDIITGKRFWAHNGNDPGEREPAVLFWYKTVRKGPGQVEFIPYLIDQDSGVGTQVTVADLNGDKLPDILVGNKKGQFVFLHRAKKTTEEEWKLFQPKKLADLEKK